MYFRKNIKKMQGYTPGEQPKVKSLIKLNTNENPYPPSPNVEECLKSLDYNNLRLYPDPNADKLRGAIANLHDYERENIIVGNGSDEILNIAVRSFVGEKEEIGCFEPTYSLYPVLAKIQNAEIVKVPLKDSDNFSFPEKLTDYNTELFQNIRHTKLFFICRPNAPTGTVFDIEKIEKFCGIFNGIVFIDEAYADFAEENCLRLVKKYPNVIIGRTLSKSYSLAGIRLGWAIAGKEIIEGMMKVKDSYNVNCITQQLAIAALQDQEYFSQTIAKIKATRRHLTEKLMDLEFKVMPSQANFVFASPPKDILKPIHFSKNHAFVLPQKEHTSRRNMDTLGYNAEELFAFLRKKNILVRYFPGEITGKYIRITIGTKEQIDSLIDCCKLFVRPV